MQLPAIFSPRVFSVPESLPRAPLGPARASHRGNGPGASGPDADGEGFDESAPRAWPPAESLDATRLRLWIASQERLGRTTSYDPPNAVARFSPPARDRQDDLGMRVLRLFTSLHVAARSGNIVLLRVLLDRKLLLDARDEKGITPLIAAVCANKPGCVRLLLASGASPDAADANGKRPLHHSAELGRRQLTEALILAGARLDATDRHGATPLHYAACANRLDITDLLLDHGAALSTFDFHGQDALAKAIKRGRLATAIDLIDRGVSVNRRAPCGSTPLHHAVSARRDLMIDLLLARGANPELLDIAGLTPNDHAFFIGDLPVMMALRTNESPSV